MDHTKKIYKSDIISCSRRTDIPAFLMDWLLEKIKKGYVDVVNPFNKTQVSRVSLNPNDVKCWVWWSKNFEKWIETYKKNRNLFNLYKGHFFQFTINSPSELEKNLKISLEKRFVQLKWLINEFGTLPINIRYDPIVFYKREEDPTIRSNLNKFEYIIKNISQLGIDKVIFSFATIYPKVAKRMTSRGFSPIDPPFKVKQKILEKLLNITKENNVSLQACCQPELLKIDGIIQAHCIDARVIEEIINIPLTKKKDYGQRKSCGCNKSKDIGGYNGVFRCKHNCTYCYANPRKI